jgi:hypothetical protein
MQADSRYCNWQDELFHGCANCGLDVGQRETEAHGPSIFALLDTTSSQLSESHKLALANCNRQCHHGGITKGDWRLKTIFRNFMTASRPPSNHIRRLSQPPALHCNALHCTPACMHALVALPLHCLDAAACVLASRFHRPHFVFAIAPYAPPRNRFWRRFWQAMPPCKCSPNSLVTPSVL